MNCLCLAKPTRQRLALWPSRVEATAWMSDPAPRSHTWQAVGEGGELSSCHPRERPGCSLCHLASVLALATVTI